jgi:hypothetical protein
MLAGYPVRRCDVRKRSETCFYRTISNAANGSFADNIVIQLKDSTYSNRHCDVIGGS